jgi:hypothetical protein
MPGLVPGIYVLRTSGEEGVDGGTAPATTREEAQSRFPNASTWSPSRRRTM